MAQVKDERIKPSAELQEMYELLVTMLEDAEAGINFVLPKADRAEQLLNAGLREIVHEAGTEDADSRAFMTASGYDDMHIALQGLCRSLHHFIPGCELP